MYSVEWWDDEEECYETQFYNELSDALDCAMIYNTCAIDDDGREYWP